MVRSTLASAIRSNSCGLRSERKSGAKRFVVSMTTVSTTTEEVILQPMSSNGSKPCSSFQYNVSAPQMKYTERERAIAACEVSGLATGFVMIRSR